MFARFSRSWSLIKASGEVLRQDKELMIFPLCSGVAALLISLSLAVPLIATGALERIEGGGQPQAALLAFGFLFYLSQ